MISPGREITGNIGLDVSREDNTIRIDIMCVCFWGGVCVFLLILGHIYVGMYGDVWKGCIGENEGRCWTGREWKGGTSLIHGEHVGMEGEMERDGGVREGMVRLVYSVG